MFVHTDTAAVRAGEELNLAALRDYLTGKIAGAEDGIAVEQFPGGHSNLTYLLRIGGKEYVLRRAPLGPVPPKAHDMAREFRVLQAVHPHFPEAPEVYVLCEDAGVIGAVFYLMERRRGIVVRKEIPPQIRAIPDYARKISETLVDTMVRMHAVDIQKHGLTSLGKPEGFVERQVKGWTERWQRSQTTPLPEMDEVAEWMMRTLPRELPPTLVHNDFKLDNIMLDEHDPSRVVAVLDWEMTTVGDPLIDVGLTLCYWGLGGAPHLTGEDAEGMMSGPGWFTREEFVDRYASRTGRDLSAIGWHEVLGYFKLAVILQQIYYRWYKGQTKDDRFRDFDKRVESLARTAARLMEKA